VSLARPPSLSDALTQEQSIGRLEQVGVTVTLERTLNKVGEPSGPTPIQVMQIMLLGPLARWRRRRGVYAGVG